MKLVRMSASQLEALCPQVRRSITTGDKPQPAGQLVLLGMCSGLIVAGCDLLQNLSFPLVHIEGEMQRRHPELGTLKSMAKKSLM